MTPCAFHRPPRGTCGIGRRRLRQPPRYHAGETKPGRQIACPTNPSAPPERAPRPAPKKPTPPPPGRAGGGKGGGKGPTGAGKGKAPPPRRRKRKFDKKTVIGIVTTVLVLGLVIFFAFTVGSGSPPPTVGANANGPEKVGIPTGAPLAAINTAVYGQVIDGIKCEVNEQVVYHIHAHLAIFVDGKPKQVPQGIGIAPPLQLQNAASGAYVAGGSCFYWLHTHAADGIIHIESPTQAQYTLGQFFDVWGQTLAPDQVGPAVGLVTAVVDGKPFPGNPRTIPLTAHGVIQLSVGTPVPFQPLDLSQTSL